MVVPELLHVGPVSMRVAELLHSSVMARGAWFIGLTALLGALLGFPGPLSSAENAPSWTVRFWVAGQGPGNTKDHQLSEVRFFPDGRRLLHRNGLDVSDFETLPIGDGRGRLIGETYHRTSDRRTVLRVDFKRDVKDRIVRETLHLARTEGDSEIFPESRMLGWYTYAWDRSGRLVEITFFWLGITHSMASDAEASEHHKVVLKYEGESRDPSEATILNGKPGLDVLESLQPLIRLRFLYDGQNCLIGAQSEGGWLLEIEGACARPPERLLPVVLNPFGGPWRPVVGNPIQRSPRRVPSLPR